MSSNSESELSDLENEVVENEPELNIVLVGESGAGKSAVINQVFDKDLVESSDQATGCTLDNAKISGKIKDYPHLTLNLFDTAGLSESEDGNVGTAKAFAQLIKLCYAIRGGIHLVIFVHPKGRIATGQFKSNYRLFYEELCENRIPCLLVVTHCDNDKPLNSWWTNNKDIIRNQLKFKFVDGICVSTERNLENGLHTASEAYTTSRHWLIRAIAEYALPRPLPIDSWKRKIFGYMRSLYNAFASWIGLQTLSLRPELETIFMELGYTGERAKQESDNLLLEMQDDLMGPYKVVNANAT